VADYDKPSVPEANQEALFAIFLEELAERNASDHTEPTSAK